jgi:hypothetical protein
MKISSCESSQAGITWSGESENYNDIITIEPSVSECEGRKPRHLDAHSSHPSRALLEVYNFAINAAT